VGKVFFWGICLAKGQKEAYSSKEKKDKKRKQIIICRLR
jgi:hypothetical protein